jgi:hypothetical protein
MIFYKHLKFFSVPEEEFLEEIISSNVPWFTAKNQENYDLNFVKNKDKGSFFLSKLKNFPKIKEYMEKNIPNVVVKNSYVTKCFPRYEMEKHIDANRETAIIMPLGNNKGILNFYYKDLVISRCVYKGPILSKVDVIHSAVNTSDEIRYSISIELSGSYAHNYFKYW